MGKLALQSCHVGIESSHYSVVSQVRGGGGRCWEPTDKEPRERGSLLLGHAVQRNIQKKEKAEFTAEEGKGTTLKAERPARREGVPCHWNLETQE